MTSRKHWAVVPAAGVGRRMGAPIPKQYLSLAGRTVIERTLTVLAEHVSICGVVVAVAADDRWWSAVELDGVSECIGGAERCHSVLNGLRALLDMGASANDWCLVHDAVRPLLRGSDIDRLLAEVGDYADGGLLGLRVRDTMKRTDTDSIVRETVSREHLWHALTPQMFSVSRLVEALETCLRSGELVTDEAQAMERAGARPRMVEGRPDNIKITHADDLELASRLLGGEA